jgi:hypothetical protein
MEKWAIGQNELQQYIDNGLIAYYFAPGKKPKIQLKSYSCGLIGINSKELPQTQEDIDGFNSWVINWDCIVFSLEKVKSFEETHPELIDNIANQDSPISVEGYSCFKAVELAEGIQNRWPGIERWELADKIDNKIKDPHGYDFPMPYWMRKHKINPATKEHIYFCERIDRAQPYEVQYNGEDQWYDFSCIAFNMKDVSSWEKGKSWLFYVDAVGIDGQTENNGTHDVFLTADDICKRWALSPAQLVDIIQGNHELPVYWRKYDDAPF